MRRRVKLSHGMFSFIVALPTDNHAMPLIRSNAPLGTAQLKAVLTLRWVSAGVIVIVALLAPPLLDLKVAVAPILAIAAALSLLNVVAIRFPRVSVAILTAHLAFDLCAWGLFFLCSGGTVNPLTSFMLPIIAVGAALLPIGFAWALAALSVVIYLTLWFTGPSLPMQAAMAPKVHLAGMIVTFVLAAVVVVGFIGRLTSAIRARDAALARVQAQRLRQNRIVALANQAASAAHELGTPLGTVKIITSELLTRDDLPDEVLEDIDVIEQQVDRCTETLQSLTERGGSARAFGSKVATFDMWLRDLLQRWHDMSPHAILKCDKLSPTGSQIIADDSLERAIHNLLTNAANAAPDTPVVVTATLERSDAIIEIADQGPGFGIATKTPGPYGGMGVGLDIARAAIDHHGGRVSFRQRPGGGTISSIRLPLNEPARA